MSGKDAIIEKIRADAMQKANSTLEEGTKKAQEAISIAYNDAKIYKEKNMAESFAERDEIVRRKITVANLEVKKLLLQAKKEVIDKAFVEAIDAVKQDTEGYKALIKRMLSFAEDGDEVVLSQTDKDVLTPAFIGECAKGYGKKITVSSSYGKFAGGIVLSGKGSDKNLTLEVELNSVRSEYEPAIAQLLFGE